MKQSEKTYPFIVELKSNVKNRINNISQLLLFIAFVVFTYKAISYFIIFQGSVPIIFNPGLRLAIFAVLIVVWWLYCLYLRRAGSAYYYRLGLFAAALGWYMYPKGFYFFIGYLIAAVLEKPVKVEQEIAFADDEIVMNTFPERIFGWESLNNVVMKDGILTLDFKNNKLIQREINEAVTTSTEEEFNVYCAKMLKAES